MAVDIPRDGNKGLDRGLLDERLWQWLCRHGMRCVCMGREVLHKGWVYREWLLAHEVRWCSTGEYNGWLVLEHWWLVWEAYAPTRLQTAIWRNLNALVIYTAVDATSR